MSELRRLPRVGAIMLAALPLVLAIPMPVSACGIGLALFASHRSRAVYPIQHPSVINVRRYLEIEVTSRDGLLSFGATNVHERQRAFEERPADGVRFQLRVQYVDCRERVLPIEFTLDDRAFSQITGTVTVAVPIDAPVRAMTLFANGSEHSSVVIETASCSGSV